MATTALMPIAGTIEKPAEAARPVRRRASRACYSCRAKKVKCNVVKGGVPCHNCHADEIDCVVSDARKRRRYRTDGAGLDRSPFPSAKGVAGLDIEETFSRIDGFLATAPTSLDFELSNHPPHVYR